MFHSRTIKHFRVYIYLLKIVKSRWLLINLRSKSSDSAPKSVSTLNCASQSRPRRQKRRADEALDDAKKIRPKFPTRDPLWLNERPRRQDKTRETFNCVHGWLNKHLRHPHVTPFSSTSLDGLLSNPWRSTSSHHPSRKASGLPPAFVQVCYSNFAYRKCPSKHAKKRIILSGVRSDFHKCL